MIVTPRLKCATRFAKHGLRFGDAEQVFFEPCVTFADARFDSVLDVSFRTRSEFFSQSAASSLQSGRMTVIEVKRFLTTARGLVYCWRI